MYEAGKFEIISLTLSSGSCSDPRESQFSQMMASEAVSCRGGGGLAWSSTLHVTNLRSRETRSHRMWRAEGCYRLLGAGGGARAGAATASRIAEGSGKDRDSFGFDFRVVAAVIPPP